MLKTLEQLAPQWNEELKIPLKQGQEARNPKLNINGYKYCIIGEIYGFSDNYIHKYDDNCCSDCCDLGMELYLESTLKRDNPIIVELIDHINEYHPEL